MQTKAHSKIEYTKRNRKEHLQGYLFLSPAVLIVIIFIALSVLFVVFLSFNKVNLFKSTYEFVSLDNYKRIFGDQVAKKALLNTIKFSAIVVPIQTILALIVSSILYSNIKGKYFFRTVYFLPTLTSSSALTIIFMFMFSVTGPINGIMLRLGLYERGINFLNNPNFALNVIIAMNIWSTIPMYTTMYLASLQDMPYSMLEAADIDGADGIKKFIYILVPYLKPITTYVLLTGIIGTLQMFDQAYIFSNGSGGPANSTLTISLMVYRYAFGTQNAMGYASAIAIVLAIVIFVVSRISEKLNESESDY